MHKDTIKTKLVTITVMTIIVCVLFLSSYLLFLQESKVDLTKNINLFYSGESGNAVLTVRVSNMNYNQRKQEFMDSITYDVSTNGNLKNGDVITIEASYDEQLAISYHLKPINKKRTLIVEGLPQQIEVENSSDIPYAFLLDINEAGQNFFTKHSKEIIEDHFIMFDEEDEILFSNNRLIHRLFLDSLSSQNYDRILDVYCLSAKGSMIDDEGVKLTNQEQSIYYLVIYNEINDAYIVKEENVYGEKLIINDEKLDDQAIYDVVRSKYQKEYDIKIVY